MIYMQNSNAFSCHNFVIERNWNILKIFSRNQYGNFICFLSKLPLNSLLLGIEFSCLMKNTCHFLKRQEIQKYWINYDFLNASKYCGSVLKNDFVVVFAVVVVLVLVVVVRVLTNFYHIFKESDYFESLVETCPKWKIIVGAG